MQTTASEDARPPWPWWYGPLGFIAGAVCGFISAGIVWAALGVDDPSESPGAIVAGTVLLDGSLVGAALLFASFVRRPRGWHFGLRRTRVLAGGWLGGARPRHVLRVRGCRTQRS